MTQLNSKKQQLTFKSLNVNIVDCMQILHDVILETCFSDHYHH